jgi:hypothetical protein
MDNIKNDFLKMYHYKEKTNFDYIVKQILYTSKSKWIIQQYVYEEPYEDIVYILDNNIRELLSKFKTNDIIKYIVNNLINIYYKLKNNNSIEILFFKLFFLNIKNDILKKIVKTIILKNNKYHQELTDTLLNLYNKLNTHVVFNPLINEFNNLTINYISNNDIVDAFRIYVNNNNIVKKLFNSDLSCIDIIINNIKEYIQLNESIGTYANIDIICLLKYIIHDNSIICNFSIYSLNLHKNIKEYNIHDGKLLKDIIQHFNYIYKFECLKNTINYPVIVKTNINSILHNDEMLQYFIFGLSKVIMNVIHNNASMDIIYNIVSYFKYINNIDTVLQYYYESLKIRIKYYLINNTDFVKVVNIENKLLEYLELVNYSKLQISNNIFNYIDNFKTSIDFKLFIGTDKSIFINKKLTIEKYNINIPTSFVFSKDIDTIKEQYKTLYNTNNRELELSYKDTVVKLSISNTTITGSLLPMTMLYYYGSSDKPNIDIFNDMFNNQNEELMNRTLNILKNNNLIVNDKLNIPTSNIILNENIIDYKKIIEKINYDRSTITKCYIMKTAKTLKNNITKEELYNFTKQNLKYFDLDNDLFEDTLKYCVDKELLTENNSGLLEY